jgi:hypothetical protein
VAGVAPFVISIAPLYTRCGPLVQTHALIHEATHYLAPKDHFALDVYRDNSHEYDQLLPVNAVRNPDCYAYFAMQMAKGGDRVLTRSM